VSETKAWTTTGSARDLFEERLKAAGPSRPTHTPVLVHQRQQQPTKPARLSRSKASCVRYAGSSSENPFPDVHVKTANAHFGDDTKTLTHPAGRAA
jgi:hypothetical protein